MSLFTHNEICRYCEHAVWHKCCNSFCRCKIDVTPDFVTCFCTEKAVDVHLANEGQKATVAMCWKCAHCITEPAGHGAIKSVGCKEMTAEQWTEGWNTQSGNQDGCPLLKER